MMQSYLTRFRANLTLSEISGSLGDLGTLLPILISLSITNQISLSSSLVFGGLFNILTGVMFKVPMCVQPMKAIAASALTNNLSIYEVVSAGMFVSSVSFFLGITGLIGRVKTLTPLPVIRGIQLGAGIQLSIKAIQMLSPLKWINPNFDWLDNYYLYLVSMILVILFYDRKKVPSALILFILGLVLMIGKMVKDKLPGPEVKGYDPKFIVPTGKQFGDGILKAGLGQLPLTLLNSVIALATLADDLFPLQAPFDTNHIAMSVGIMNLIGGFFGSMPYCHGSGGLAGQYQFGARSEVSIILLGLFKLLLGLIFGDSLVACLKSYPKAILSTMLFICGLQLAKASKNYSTHLHKDIQSNHQLKINEDLRKSLDKDYLIMLFTAALQLGFSSDAIGFLGGVVMSILFYLRSRFENRATSNVNDFTEEPFQQN